MPMPALNIPAEVLDQVKLTPEELRLEIAVYLYAQQKLTMAQARHLSGLDQLTFQQALAQRNEFIHYDWSDVQQDLANLGIEL